MSFRSRNIYRFFLGPILSIIAYFFVIFLAMSTASVIKGESYADYEGLIYLCEGIIGIIFFVAVLLTKRKMEWSCPRWAPGKPLDWSYSVVGALAMLGIAVAYFYVVTRLHFPAIQDSLKEYEEMMEVKSISQVDLYMNVFATCILIPVLEEIIFRGLIMDVMLEAGYPVLAITFSALYFGVMHGQPVQIGYALLAGLILGSIYYLTKNLVMSIIAHVIFNILGSGIYMLFSLSETADNVLSFIEIAAIVPFIVLTVYLGLKRSGRLSGKKTEDDEDEGLSESEA